MEDSSAESSKAIHFEGGLYGTLGQQRLALRTDIERVSYVRLDYFLDKILPQSYQASFPKLDDLVTSLRDKSILDKDDHWSGFPLSSKDVNEREVKFYGRLVPIIAAISKVASSVAKKAYPSPNLVEYANSGDITPESAERTSSSRPDGFFRLIDRPKKAKDPKWIHWWHIAVVAEFKKVASDGAILDNIDKLLWGLHHILREDICRDFVFGFTIENTTMKLWYCDRSNIIISDEFDLHKNYIAFLKFCISILYASRAELGWDMTIERLEPKKPSADENSEGKEKKQGVLQPEAPAAKASGGAGKRNKPPTATKSKAADTQKGSSDAADPDDQAQAAQYIISVRVSEQLTRRFITSSAISLLGADGILGRGTRVWKAYELLHDGSQSKDAVAIKDYWIDDDRLREGEVRKQILAAAPNPQYRTMLEKRYVEYVCYGDVYREKVLVTASRDGTPKLVVEMRPDSTLDVSPAISCRNKAFSLFPPEAKPSKSHSQAEQQASGTHTPVDSSAYHKTAPPKRPLPGVRTRSRLVMKQVAEPLHCQKSLRTVFNALCDASLALHIVHSSGWMHRDISTGNILVHNGRGLLADFEYAKQIPRPEGDQQEVSAHGGRTGTPYFMSIEVQLATYLFKPRKLKVPPQSLTPIIQSEPPSPSPTPSVGPSAGEDKVRRRGRVSGAAPHGAEPEDYPGQSQTETEPSPDRPHTPSDAPKASRKQAAPPFVYNPAHDYESLVWIAVYFIINRVVAKYPGNGQQPPANLQIQRNFAGRIFSRQHLDRLLAYTRIEEDRETEMDTVVKRLHPAMRQIGEEVSAMMASMQQLYMSFESLDVTTIASSKAVLCCHQTLVEHIKKILAILERGDIEVAPLPDVQVSTAGAAVDNKSSEPATSVNEVSRPDQKKRKTK